MKKLISLILVIAILGAFVACNKQTDETTIDDSLIDVSKQEETISSDAQDDEFIVDTEETEENEKEETSSQESQTQDAEDKNSEVQTKPSTTTQDEEKPSEVPPQIPADEPETTVPESTVPESTVPSGSTLGNTLLNDFNSKASSGMNPLQIAESLMNNPSIAFNGGAMPVEEGLLSGFDNYEVKGFKSGATFAPMISSIPFVGYVFELENASDTSSFISALKSNANPRWNICSEADEMITGSNGNLVFFVMCPESLEQE